jgi:hypothetical protein
MNCLLLNNVTSPFCYALTIISVAGNSVRWGNPRARGLVEHRPPPRWESTLLGPGLHRSGCIESPHNSVRVNLSPHTGPRLDYSRFKTSQIHPTPGSGLRRWQYLPEISRGGFWNCARWLPGQADATSRKWRNACIVSHDVIQIHLSEEAHSANSLSRLWDVLRIALVPKGQEQSTAVLRRATNTGSVLFTGGCAGLVRSRPRRSMMACSGVPPTFDGLSAWMSDLGPARVAQGTGSRGPP